jgi:signal transduction histidine kinase
MARILVVEDSPTQARELAFILEDAGFEVEAAADAEEGLERFRHGPFDLVLSDLVLPGASGFDLCRRIKSEPGRSQTPVVVITSQADPVNVLRGLEAGADGFMTKDREPAEIVGRLRRTLAWSAQPPPDGQARTPVYFFDTQFEIVAGRRQLLNVLLSAFEDLVHVNQKVLSSEAALREMNARLEEAARSERDAHETLKKAQCQLVQAEKLSALGQMVAGVAHEINNPLAYVVNNVAVLQRDVKALRDLLHLYQEAEGILAEHQADTLRRIREFAERIDLTYTLDNLEGLMTRSREGLKRIQQIVKDLREFARLDESDVSEVDLNEGIRSTIQIIRGRAKTKQVELELDLGPLPRVSCLPAKINQVVLNLVANALDATRRGGKVTVSTRAIRDGVEVHVVDTGSGIDPAIRDKIFDPFFTTKPPGEGTGLGLSISYGIVQEHGGRIDFDSTPGQGTRFIVRLPSKAHLTPEPAG